MRTFYADVPEESLTPRFDAIGPNERLDPNGPLVAAYLGGRPVVLARRDPRVRRTPGVPSDMMVPVTMSRFRRSLDIEAGRGTMRYEPSLIDDWPASHMPFGSDCASCDRSRNVAIAVGSAILTFLLVVAAS